MSITISDLKALSKVLPKNHLVDCASIPMALQSDFKSFMHRRSLVFQDEKIWAPWGEFEKWKIQLFAKQMEDIISKTSDPNVSVDTVLPIH